MTYALAIGDRAYSSWSLRGWLVFAAFGLEVETVLAPMDDPRFAETLRTFAPARTVPALRIAGVGVIWDTLAIAETVAERHPGIAFWPGDPGRRALARALAAEMHSGFRALREACAMDLRAAHAGFAPSPEVRADLARIEELWAAARATVTEGRAGEGGESEGGAGGSAAGGSKAGEGGAGAGPSGPWLFGAYSLADVFFAPVAARVAGYGLPVGPAAAAYVAAHLAHPAFRAWRADALADPRRLPTGGDGLAELPWPA